MQILELRSRLAHYEKDLPPHQRPGYGQSGFSGLTSSGLSGLSSYGSSGGGLGSGLTGLGGGLGGGLTGLGGGPTGYGGGLSGLGGGPTGYGGGPTGYGGGLTGLGGGLTGLGGAAGIGSGLTGLGGGLTGLGGVAGIGSGLTGASSYSPYSTYSPYSAHSSPALSSGLGPYAQQVSHEGGVGEATLSTTIYPWDYNTAVFRLVVQKLRRESAHAHSFNSNVHQECAHARILVAILDNQPENRCIHERSVTIAHAPVSLLVQQIFIQALWEVKGHTQLDLFKVE